MSGHRQKGKNKKRKKSWHRGRGEHFRFQRAMKRWPLKEGSNDTTISDMGGEGDSNSDSADPNRNHLLPKGDGKR